jgi:hypothetical protein
MKIYTAAIIVLASAPFLTACAGKPFNVKSSVELPRPARTADASIREVNISAGAVTDEDYLFETFDANLILAGVLPVKVTLINNGNAPVDLKRARFELRNESSRKFKITSANRAFKRLISYYGISTYAKEGYKQSRADFAAHELDRKTPLSPGESRSGLLFFQVAMDEMGVRRMSLIVERLGTEGSRIGPVSLELFQ